MADTQAHTSSIKSDQRTFDAILSDKRLLHVPPYQRNFSWSNSEIMDFWDDVQNIIYEGHENYFLGSMVFILKPDNTLEVVDGQQRLATVSLLLAAIRSGLQSAGDRQRANHVESSYLLTRNFKTMEGKTKLALNEVDNDIYTQIIENEMDYEAIKLSSKSKKYPESNRLIASCYIILYDLVRKGSSDFKSIDYLVELVDTISDHISCIQIITTSEESAYILFETLNDRGIDLTLSDMLKNFLFSKAGRRMNEVKLKWNETTTYVGQQYMKSFIRHEWVSRYGHTREKDLYKRIKSEIKSNPKALDYATTLRSSAVVYDAIRNPENETWSQHSAKCKKLISDVALLGTIQCYPLILSAYFAKPKWLEIVLEWIVNITIRYNIIGGKGTGNLETIYAKASSRMRDKNVKLSEIKNILMGAWPSDEEFKVSFARKTLSSPRIIKYILAAMEMKMANNDSLIPNPSTLSVEHILPKKPDQSWPAKVRKQEFISEHCNKIGNLTILTESMNREAQSKDFSSKKITYNKSNYKITKAICKYKDWNEASINDRQSKLAELAVEIWGI